ncbi:MAG: hypothetical protein GWP19_00635 [Planctomycetia bacterium]|nr:hypothetical protein [Planctomycetia bacterium]
MENEKNGTGRHWITGAKAISHHLGFGKTKVSSLLNAGRIPNAKKFDGSWMVRSIDLDSFILYGKQFSRLTRHQRDDVKAGLGVWS